MKHDFFYYSKLPQSHSSAMSISFKTLIISFSLFAHTFILLAQNTIHKGGIIRTDASKKRITLAFTCADMADGAESILLTLKQNHIKAAFFVTGSFMEKYPQYVALMKKGGHYIGSHSYSHPLYCAWDNPDSTIISHEDFTCDMKKSLSLLKDMGIKKATYFMPPYEHYNQTISLWAEDMGLRIVNFTPGSTSNADYTTPDMKNYRSSDEIYHNILQLEEKEGLHGHIMLFHIGTSRQRTDKFYASHLMNLITELKRRGYTFCTLEKALK